MPFKDVLAWWREFRNVSQKQYLTVARSRWSGRELEVAVGLFAADGDLRSAYAIVKAFDFANQYGGVYDVC